MRDLSIPRITAAARDLLAVAREAGVDDADSLRATGLTAATLERMDTQIDLRAELRLIANVRAARPGWTGLGLDAGGRAHLSAYGLLGLTVVSSATVREALFTGIRYQDLCYPIPHVRLSQVDGRTVMTFTMDGLPADLHGYLADHLVAALAKVSGELTGTRRFARSIDVRQPRPPHVTCYPTVCGVEPRFGAPLNRIILDDQVLDTPLPRADPAALRALEAECAATMERRRAQVGMSGLVLERLRRLNGPTPGMATIAADLHVTTRTLRRRLAAEGTSFRALDAEARLTRARQLLETTPLTVEAIAHSLGYASTSAFVHAYRRWTGTTPRGRAGARAIG